MKSKTPKIKICKMSAKILGKSGGYTAANNFGATKKIKKGK
jgi:hypothetical protein